MTKTLTEQWREGTLPAGHYYCKLYYNGFKPRIQECVKSRYDSKSCIPMSCGCEGEEVLAPVPSYDKVKEMSQKIERLEFDNEALEMVINAYKETNSEVVSNSVELSRKALQLKKRLSIATKALKKYQEAINRFKKDPMNNIIMLAHQLIYDIDVDTKKTLKEMEGVK